MPDISFSIIAMREFLGRSLSSVNRNKINGLQAETEFREYLRKLGFADRISVGGWILRNTRGHFSDHVVAIFPEVIRPDETYGYLPDESFVPHRLHTICATFHQIGIRSYFATPTAAANDLVPDLSWKFKRLGVPQDTVFAELEEALEGFTERERRYNPLRYNSDTEIIDRKFIPEEFSKENIRVFIQKKFFSEMSDIDGILWGERYTYPIEIKEKTIANDSSIGPYFGLDLGPFVKLAFFAAKKGSLHSLFIVRQIDNVEERNLVSWRAITFEKLAQYASWVPMGGGQNMGGGGSTVVKIPAIEFSEFDTEFVQRL